VGYRPGFHKEQSSSFLVPPFFAREDFGRNPEEVVTESYTFEEEVRVFAEGSSVEKCRGVVGDIFTSKSCPLYSFLTKMEVLEEKRLEEMISRKLLGDADFGRRILNRCQYSYEYTVLRCIPPWAFTLM
jgi:hypothetical protein